MSTLGTAQTTEITIGPSGYASPLTITSGGSVNVTTGIAVYGQPSGPQTLVNSGTGGITSSDPTSAGAGVFLADGGSVTNNTTITAAYNGVVIEGADGTITDLGTVTATNVGIVLGDGGSVSVTSTGLVSATTNEGIDLAAGGTVTNAGIVENINPASSAFAFGVNLAGGGSVVNTGTISGFIAGIAAPAGATSPGFVTNSGGTITGTGTGAGVYSSGVYLADGGSVTNTAGLISGEALGVIVNTAAGTVTNGGTIIGTNGDGIKLSDGGQVSVASTGSVSGAGFGIYIGTVSAAGIVSNSGKISASAGIGVEFNGTGNGTLVNSGTISGSSGQDAVLFGSGTNVLVVNPGAVFTGTVDGGSGSSNTLELGSAATTGTISGIGTNFIDFAAVTVNAGAHWDLSSANPFAGTDTIGSGATLELLSGATVAGTIAFATAIGTLKIDGTSLPTSPNHAIRATIVDFMAGNTIDLTGAAFTSSSYTLSGVDVLQFTESGRTYDLQLNGSFAGQAFTLASDGSVGTNITVGTATPTPTATIADIVFNTQDGTVPVWGVNGTQITAAAYTTDGGATVGVPAPGWNIVDATGDFGGSTGNDILWQTTAGQVAIWEMKGSQIQSAGYTMAGGAVVGVPAPGWDILGVANFFGQGDNDILWQTNNGSPAIWEMNGTQVEGAGYTMQGSTVVGAPGSDWHIIGAGDFTGNGQDDILWRTDEGNLAVWQMNGLQITSAAYLTEGGQQVNAPGPDWHLITTADFTGNGTDDLLWETNSGAIAIWDMSGSDITGAAYLTQNGTQVNAPAGWDLVGAKDVTGNGHADLLWQTPGGNVAVWEMNGAQVVGAGYLAVNNVIGSTPPDWTIAQHHYNFI